MIDLKSQTLEEMTATLKEMGEPAFRGKQVFTWLHKGAPFICRLVILYTLAYSASRSLRSPSLCHGI